jgi:UDP-N-acetylmuramate dehydrogenase
MCFGDRLRQNEPLARHTTLGVGGPAQLWVTATTLAELSEAVTLVWCCQMPVLVLGGGANLLVSDTGVAGLVVHNRCQRVWVAEEDPALVTAESGTVLASLAHRLANQGLSGLEWAVGVPGTLGGALVNNAGAYGQCMADCLVRAQVLGLDGQPRWRAVDWFEYEYRSSRLKRQPPGAGQAVILQAELRLKHRPLAEIETQMAACTSRRKASQPAGASAGSMFKNPPGDCAGRLIEAAGLNGTPIGGAQISPVHANFFVNQGNASAADFAALIELARSLVRARFGVELELEIQKVGVWE